MTFGKAHNGITKIRKGIYHTEAGLSIVHDEEDKCWKIIFRHTTLHRCPTLADAKYICARFYAKEDNAEQTLMERLR